MIYKKAMLMVDTQDQLESILDYVRKNYSQYLWDYWNVKGGGYNIYTSLEVTTSRQKEPNSFMFLTDDWEDAFANNWEEDTDKALNEAIKNFIGA